MVENKTAGVIALGIPKMLLIVCATHHWCMTRSTLFLQVIIYIPYSITTYDKIHLIKVICINYMPDHFSGSFGAVFSVIGFILNILVVLALRQVAQSDFPTLFVISLSVSDLFMCGFTLPLQSARFLFRYYILKGQSLRIFWYNRYFYMILLANLMVRINIFSGIGYLAVLMVLCVRYSLSWFMARPVSPCLTLRQ